MDWPDWGCGSSSFGSSHSLERPNGSARFVLQLTPLMEAKLESVQARIRHVQLRIRRHDDSLVARMEIVSDTRLQVSEVGGVGGQAWVLGAFDRPTSPSSR